MKKDQVSKALLVRGMVFGLLGGLLGTLAMDLGTAAVVAALGYSIDVSFYIIGRVAAFFLAYLGLHLTGSFGLGVIVHYVIGLGLGLFLGVIIPWVKALRADKAKSLMFGIIYVQVLSQPFLVAPPIAMGERWSVAKTWQWYAVSFFLHLAYSVILALCVIRGLRDGEGVPGPAQAQLPGGE